MPAIYPISAGYGYSPSYPENGGMHYGIDYACPVGTPGTVRYAGRVVLAADVYPPDSHTRQHDGIWVAAGAWGRYLEIERPNGERWGYCHLSSFAPFVSEGVRVEPSHGPLYYTGNTGRTTGPHLHEQCITPDGRHIDPGVI